MKKIFFFIAVLATLCVSAQIDDAIPAKPSPPKLVNDFTGNFLTAGEKESLERKLVSYDDTTSSQIAVVIVESLKGYSAADYAVALGRKWGVGGKEFSNGILILISTGGGDGNRDAYIAVGYGLEGAIPDITAGQIIDNELIPNFKGGNYFQGLNETVDAIILAAAGKYKAPASYGSRKKKDGFKPWMIIGVILFIILSGMFGGGGRGGTYVSRGGYTGWGGGGWSGGGGGSSGGGGFGGFGGGSFGGGGAGGKW